jgi:hypothetical protein
MARRLIIVLKLPLILTNSNKFQQIPTNSNKFQQIPTNSNKFQQIPTNSKILIYVIGNGGGQYEVNDSELPRTTMCVTPLQAAPLL